MPLLCHARILRRVRSHDGASQLVDFVNHNLEAVEPVSWDAASAPNASFSSVVDILNNCPQHDEGIQFAFLADIKPCPYYGLRLMYDDREGPRSLFVAALVASPNKSKPEQVSDDGYKVVTVGVKDVANPAGSIDKPVGNHSLVGFCSMNDLAGFRLDPPRNKDFRFALVLFTKADDHEGLHIHKLEYIEMDQIENAVKCMQKLRKLSKGVHSVSTEKRSHSIAFECLSERGVSPREIKKARNLQSVPTDASWPE